MSCRFLLLILLLFAAWSTSIFALAGAITTGTWLSKTPMQIGRNCELAVVNGKIYAVGGDATGFLGTNEEYDPATDTWVFKAAMPTPRGHFGIAVYQNKIYCIGGYAAGGATVINEVYDPATDKWETKAPMPTPRLNLQANVVNGKIYLMGGSPNGTLNEVYDPVNNTWLTKKSIPKATDSAKVGIGNKIYVISSGLNQIYDCETDNWSVGASPPLPVTLAKAAATTGVNAPMRIYVFGIDADMPFWQISFRNFTAQSYDPKNDSWTVCAFMPKGRYSASVALVDDRLYVIGGYTLESLAAEFTLNRLIKPSAVNTALSHQLSTSSPRKTKPTMQTMFL
jgi:N-acetylneuraminic acid mutarotase